MFLTSHIKSQAIRRNYRYYCCNFFDGILYDFYGLFFSESVMLQKKHQSSFDVSPFFFFTVFLFFFFPKKSGLFIGREQKTYILSKIDEKMFRHVQFLIFFNLTIHQQSNHPIRGDCVFTFNSESYSLPRRRFSPMSAILSCNMKADQIGYSYIAVHRDP